MQLNFLSQISLQFQTKKVECNFGILYFFTGVIAICSFNMFFPVLNRLAALQYLSDYSFPASYPNSKKPRHYRYSQSAVDHSV